MQHHFSPLRPVTRARVLSYRRWLCLPSSTRTCRPSLKAICAFLISVHDCCVHAAIARRAAIQRMHGGSALAHVRFTGYIVGITPATTGTALSASAPLAWARLFRGYLRISRHGKRRACIHAFCVSRIAYSSSGSARPWSSAERCVVTLVQ
jgi:hypothetical protein